MRPVLVDDILDVCTAWLSAAIRKAADAKYSLCTSNQGKDTQHEDGRMEYPGHFHLH